MNEAGSRKVVVVGGGVTGLSAAVTLRDAGLDLTLVEATDRLGGKIRTERASGYTIEAGPDSILSYKPAGLSLIERIGRLDRVINAREDGEGTHILHRGRLEPLPEGMTALVPVNIRSVLATRLLSWRGKLRLGREYLLPARHSDDDESVGGFVRRRLGDEFFERMAEPLLSGIYAGDADRLSVLATFPRLRLAEQQHGSLIRSAVAQRLAGKAAASSERRWAPFISLRDGLGEIIDGLETSLDGTDIRLGVRAVALHPSGTEVQVELSTGERLDADGVVLAIPAWAAADVLRSTAPRPARELDAIPYVSTATISMAFAGPDPLTSASGRGFVIPRCERRMLTAVTWSSNKFAGRAPDGQLLVRCYAGHAADQTSLSLDDDELVARARQELADITGIATEPLLTRVYCWPQAMPQYNLGHMARVAGIEGLVAELPWLALAGAAYRGVGIPDCIQDGISQATRLIDRITAIPPADRRLAPAFI